MTDLTTMHLQRLLDQATPGPWEVDDPFFPEYITTRSGHYVLWNTNEEAWWSNKDEDVHLAAAAPELAQEVIRLRDALGYLVEETRLAAENSDDVVVQKRVADAIKTTVAKIQGDHDE